MTPEEIMQLIQSLIWLLAGVGVFIVGMAFTEGALADINTMTATVLEMFTLAEQVFETGDASRLSELTAIENRVDEMKRKYTEQHFQRLADGRCKIEHSAYFFSTISGLERVADHLINVGYSIVNPTGSQESIAQENA